jgi:hypothetical protein
VAVVGAAFVGVYSLLAASVVISLGLLLLAAATSPWLAQAVFRVIGVRVPHHQYRQEVPPATDCAGMPATADMKHDGLRQFCTTPDA